MSIEAFDMSTPLAPKDARTNDVLAIHRLWRQICDDNTEYIDNDPCLLQGAMSGLDYLVLRERRLPRILGAVSVMDCGQVLAKIDSLAVDPEYHRLGYGHALAESAIQLCSDNEKETIIVTAMPSSEKLFTDFGFEAYEVHDTGNVTMFLDIAKN